MSFNTEDKLLDVLNTAIQPLDKDYAGILKNIADARFILIGEASHGTHEFYKERAEITKQLILKKGVRAIVIEGDWPDVYRIHRYIQGKGDKENAAAALSSFQRFPTWMWRNTVIVDFIQWLRTYNDDHPEEKVSMYGMDVYSFQASMQAVIEYLKQVDPEAAERARARYACFDHHLDPQRYGYLTTIGAKKSCMEQAINQLLEMQVHAFDYISKDGLAAEEEYFYATQNALVVKNAENYYRAMFEGSEVSWNVRDTHMVETFNVIAAHLEKRFNKPAKIAVWAHNSHLGDARATEMSERHEVNVGQLLREQYNEQVYSIGFSTYAGTVTAASEWDAPAERKKIQPGMPGSYEELFHRLQEKMFWLPLTGNKELEHYLQIPRLQRAIGVIYRPDTERYSHYFFTRLPYQFNCIIHINRTTALM